jgi:hypothetical protein
MLEETTEVIKFTETLPSRNNNSAHYSLSLENWNSTVCS